MTNPNGIEAKAYRMGLRNHLAVQCAAALQDAVNNAEARLTKLKKEA